MRYFLKLAYCGASFHGWQRQPNASSVQQTLEEALFTILRVETPVTGAGRTDTGVNARVMFAHFDIESEIKEKKRFLLSINRLCGHDIFIQDIIPVDPDAHARFDAIKRTYRYFVSYEKNPFLYPLCWHCPTLLDMNTMNEAAALLLETEDFTSFAKLHSDAKTNICKVTEAIWEPWHNSFGMQGIMFTITADRFLRNMVRAVVGTLVDMGRGKLSVESFLNIIKLKNRCSAGTSMPGEALFLWNVEYPFL